MKTLYIKYLLAAAVLTLAACVPQTVRPKGSIRTVPEVEAEELEQVYTPRRMAVLVGINGFEDENWRPLNYAERDATEMAAFLKNPSKGRFDHVITLTKPEETTRDAIYQTLEYISKLNTSPLDTVLVYFSTHGTLERDGNGVLRQYLVASDTGFNDITGSAIDLAEIQQMFKSLRSRRKVLILATCHSGSGKSVLDPKMTQELGMTKGGFFVKPLDVVSEATVILSACAWGETAREDDKLKNDIYTHFFLEALESFDPNLDGATTVSEAHDYAREKTYYYTKGQQRACAKSDILGNDPIVLTGQVVRIGHPAIYSYSNSMDGVEVMINGAPKGKLPGSVVVEPGVQRVTMVNGENGNTIFDRNVKLSPGIRVAAESLLKIEQVDHSLGVGLSYRAFASQSISDSYFAPILAYGIVYGRSGPWRGTRIEAGLYGGNASDSLDINGAEWNVDYTRLDLETALLWQYRRGRLSFAGGPVIGLVYLERQLPDEFKDPDQRRLITLFGPTVNMEATVFRRLAAGVGGDINFAHLEVDYSGRLEFGYAATIYIKYNL